MFDRLIVSEEENGAVFQCEASSSSLEQPLVEQITLSVEFATSKDCECAKINLTGRKFSNRVIVTSYFNPEKYQRGEF